MEVRCTRCNRLFFRGKMDKAEIEIKCPKCGYCQTIKIAAQTTGAVRMRRVSKV